MLSHMLDQIEKVRSQMNELAEKKGRDHSEVLGLSKELDLLLNKYQRLLMEIKKEE